LSISLSKEPRRCLIAQNMMGNPQHPIGYHHGSRISRPLRDSLILLGNCRSSTEIASPHQESMLPSE